MSVLTLPKKAAGLQYKVLRLPASLFESQLMARLSDESPLRLAYEKALGSVDERAGRLLDDEGIEKRGTALRRRSEILGKAVALEAKAQARKDEAEQKLQAEQKDAAQQREQAKNTRQQGVQQAAQTEKAEKERVRRETEAREQAEKQAAVQAAEKRKQQAEDAAKAAKARIAAEEKADTAAPKAQLKQASELAKDAADKKSQAERLGELADVEKDSRKAEREARVNS